MTGLRFFQSVVFVTLLYALETSSEKSRFTYSNSDASDEDTMNILSSMLWDQDEYANHKSDLFDTDNEYAYENGLSPASESLDYDHKIIGVGDAISNARDRSSHAKTLRNTEEIGEGIPDKELEQWNTDNYWDTHRIRDGGKGESAENRESRNEQSDIANSREENQNGAQESTEEDAELAVVSEEQELKSLLANRDSTRLKALVDNGILKSGIKVSKDEVKINVRLPGVSVAKDDTYLCTAVKIDNHVKETGRPIYIKKYIPHAKQTVAHHMLLYGCEYPGSSTPGGVWDCAGLMGKSRSKYPAAPLCYGHSTILWAWAKDAPAFTLPKDIGFKVGDTTKVAYLVLQVHYKSASVFKGGKIDYSGVTVVASKHRMPRIAGVYILATSYGVVPPNKTTNFDIYCRYLQHFTIHPFAFRTHTHALGKKVLGYRIRHGIWTLIGEKSPQLPQEFYSVANNLTIRYGDILAARCVMHNFRKVYTKIGYKHTDEMCNFYIMFWTDSINEKQLDRWEKSCDNGYPWVDWSSLPGYRSWKRH